MPTSTLSFKNIHQFWVMPGLGVGTQKSEWNAAPTSHTLQGAQIFTSVTDAEKVHRFVELEGP